jgi:hypothetical protein
MQPPGCISRIRHTCGGAVAGAGIAGLAALRALHQRESRRSHWNDGRSSSRLPWPDPQTVCAVSPQARSEGLLVNCRPVIDPHVRFLLMVGRTQCDWRNASSCRLRMAQI